MNKNICFFTLVALLFSNSVLAIPYDAEYSECLKKTATDAGITQCTEKEIALVKQEIQKLSENLAVINQNYKPSDAQSIQNLSQQTAIYNDFYCSLYTHARHNDGYSDAYHSANCRLIKYLQLYRDLESLYSIALTDIKG